MTQHPAWLLMAFGLVIAGNGINVQHILPSCEFLEHKPSEAAKVRDGKEAEGSLCSASFRYRDEAPEKTSVKVEARQPLPHSHLLWPVHLDSNESIRRGWSV
jgi:hypothetical protein